MPLPVGVQQFERFTDRIILVSGLPNNRSTKFAIATAVLHLGKTKSGYCQDWKPLRYFVKDLRKGASHEVVVNMMEGYKKLQKEEYEAMNKAPVA
jgi:hypothetical protein